MEKLEFTEEQIEGAKADMVQVAKLLGYQLVVEKIEPLPKIDSRQEGEVMYWKGTVNGEPAGNRIGYYEGATHKDVVGMLIHSVAFICVMGLRPERILIEQAMAAYQFHQTDLFTAAFVNKVVDLVDAIPVTAEIPTSKFMYEQSMNQIRSDALRSIEVVRQMAIMTRTNSKRPVQ